MGLQPCGLELVLDRENILATSSPTSHQSRETNEKRDNMKSEVYE